MEWMLQVLDEVDDAVGALRFRCAGLAAEIGLLTACILGVGAVGAALATGAEFSLIGSAAVMLVLAAALKSRQAA